MKRWLFFCPVLAALMSCADDPVVLTTGDAAGTSSFNSAGHWSDGAVPHAGVDYLVALGTASVLRTPASNNKDNSCKFGGDSLSLGAVGGAKGKLIHKSHTDCVITHNNLILANGQYAHGDGGKTCTVNGSATVTSPESEPFQMQGSGNGGDRKFLWNVAMAGESGTMFEVSRTSGENAGRFLFFMGGDNTKYFGKMQSNGANIYLGFSNTKAVGGPLDVWTPDAIKLVNKGVFGAADTDGVVIARENGGITADDSGCVIFTGNKATFQATFQMPITGGPMEKQGVGIAIFDADWNAGDLSVKQGTFGFTPGKTVAGSCATYTVADGCTFSADQSQLDGKAMVCAGKFNPAGLGTVGAVTLAAGQSVAALQFDVSGLESDSVSITNLSSVAVWPLPIGLTGVGAKNRYPVLTIPVAVKQVAVEDFTDTSVADPLGIVSVGEIEVETDAATGVQTVYICQSMPVINQIANDKYYTAAEAWDDGAAAHYGAAYVTYAKLLRSGDASDNNATFPGDIYYIYGNSSTRADFRIKGRSILFNDLRMGARTIITAGAGSGTAAKEQAIYGNITILAPNDKKANFATEAGRSFIVAASLHGSGGVVATCYSTTSTAHIHVTGDNSDFTGIWWVGDNERTATGYSIMYVSSKANIGSNPATRQNEGLYIHHYGRLVVEDNITLDDPNRVVKFNNGFVDVADGKTLTITSETVWSGNATKLGKGTLVLGNAKRTSNNKNMVIQDGAFKPVTVEAVEHLQLTFTGNGYYLLDKDPDDELLGEFGLVDDNDSAITLDDGATLPVMIDFGSEKPHGSFTVPLFSINETAAAKIRDRITVVNRPVNYTVKIKEDATIWTNTDGDQRTVQRFSAEFVDVSGTVIMVQ